MATPAKGPAEGPCSTPPEGPEVHPVDQKLHPSRLAPAALQHIAAMYAGVVTPPLIIGQAVRLDTAGQTRLIAASLLIAGVATLLQTLGVKGFVGNRLPFVNAASSAGIAPMLAISEICERETDGRTITRGLRTDGIATLIGPVFGGFPTSAFAQNVGVVSLTKVRSRYVVAAAGGALLVLGVFPVLGAVVSTVPMPVLGGAGIVLFGSIAVSGIRTLSEAGLDDSSNIILVGVSLGAGIIPLAAPAFYADFPAWAQTVLGSGISAGALVAVSLNLFFHHLGTRGGAPAPALKSS
ncbi:hypothetical protein OG978_32930 [Streptomyces sp. NBC_01591]|uniref:uracil-xanthine permease family protein n=1 Tax=Streptomyces sp. NBC_01591 TaxID=2975888 RepID=UPI002DD7B016|nr:solute carrier family 23 protein [Streptomyces sp. NBC_01591]WSD71779.1 hypothetical protein OG978_32930 [Streptomyces sp. NBC_01591]